MLKLNACIFCVSVWDGIGDLCHYLDFLSELKANNLENAYFFIFIEDPNENGKLKKILDKVAALSNEHPLKKFSQNLKYITSAREAEEALQFCQQGSDGSPVNIYSICSSEDSYDEYKKPINGGFAVSLWEHDNSYSDFNHQEFLIPCSTGMGVGKNLPGIFIHDSLLNTELNMENGIFKKLEIKMEDSLVICYSHTNTDDTVAQICRLHKASGDKRKLVIFCSNKNSNFNVNADVRIVNNTGWTDDADFEQLKIKQAHSAVIGVAAGDKSSERCIADGLLPVIEFHHIGLKSSFWSALIKEIQSVKLIQEQQILLDKIVVYLKSSIEYLTNPSDATKNQLFSSIDCLEPACFALWRDEICGYIKQNYNIKPKIARNVEMFRMLAELVQNPNNSAVQKYFLDMNNDYYSKLILTIINRIRSHSYIASSYMFEERMQDILIALNNLRRTALVTDDVLRECEELNAYQAISEDRSDEIAASFLNPTVNEILSLNKQEKSIAILISMMTFEEATEMEQKDLVVSYKALLSNLTDLSLEQKNRISDFVREIIPKEYRAEFDLFFNSGHSSGTLSLFKEYKRNPHPYEMLFLGQWVGDRLPLRRNTRLELFPRTPDAVYRYANDCIAGSYPEVLEAMSVVDTAEYKGTASIIFKGKLLGYYELENDPINKQCSVSVKCIAAKMTLSVVLALLLKIQTLAKQTGMQFISVDWDLPEYALPKNISGLTINKFELLNCVLTYTVDTIIPQGAILDLISNFDAQQQDKLQKDYIKLSAAIDQNHSITFAIRDENDKFLALAVISAVPNVTNVCNLDYLFVAPELRGQGTGGKLLQLVEVCLRQANINNIVLHTDEYMVPNFYLKRGYTRAEASVITDNTCDTSEESCAFQKSLPNADGTPGTSPKIASPLRLR